MWKLFFCSLGTTEKIFESKLEVYDVYVDNQNIKCKPHLSWIAHFNNADRDRLEQLDIFRWERNAYFIGIQCYNPSSTLNTIYWTQSGLV